MNRLYSFGYQGKHPQDLLTWCTQNNAIVVDVRIRPLSHDARWSRQVLTCTFVDIYRWCADWGNTAYGTGRIEIMDFDRGWADVSRKLETTNIVLMCACRDREKCHRGVLAAMLRERFGIEVEEILAEPQIGAGTLPYISLWQPWAFLFASGEKQFETRSWPTSYRGLCGVHAAKKQDSESLELCLKEPFRSALVRKGIHRISELPFGAIIGQVRIVSCDLIADHNRPDYPERSFGDFTPGRFMHRAIDPSLLVTPIQFKAQQGKYIALPLEVANQIGLADRCDRYTSTDNILETLDQNDQLGMRI